MEKTPVPQEYPRNRSCQTCDYLGVLITAGGLPAYVCRRNAPRVFAVALPKPSGLQWVSTSAWPDTALNEWCGDYTPRPSVSTDPIDPSL